MKYSVESKLKEYWKNSLDENQHEKLAKLKKEILGKIDTAVMNHSTSFTYFGKLEGFEVEWLRREGLTVSEKPAPVGIGQLDKPSYTISLLDRPPTTE